MPDLEGSLTGCVSNTLTLGDQKLHPHSFFPFTPAQLAGYSLAYLGRPLGYAPVGEGQL